MICMYGIQAFTTLTGLCHLEDPVVFPALIEAEKELVISSTCEL